MSPAGGYVSRPVGGKASPLSGSPSCCFCLEVMSSHGTTIWDRETTPHGRPCQERASAPGLPGSTVAAGRSVEVVNHSAPASTVPPAGAPPPHPQLPPVLQHRAGHFKLDHTEPETLPFGTPSLRWLRSTSGPPPCPPFRDP